MESQGMSVTKVTDVKKNDWYERNRKKIIACCGVTVVLVVGGILISKKHIVAKIHVADADFSKCRRLLRETRDLARHVKAKKAKNISVKTMPSPSAVVQAQTVMINRIGTSKTPHYVREGIRNLHAGWNASPEKIATATEHGFELRPGQTWVVAYNTGKLVS